MHHINHFISHFNLKDYDEMASLSPDKLQIMVEDYVMHLKKKVSPNIINVSISAIKSFLECNDIDLRWNKINRLKPALVKRTGKEAWTTNEIQKMLENTTSKRAKTLIHFLASSGIRIGAIDGLKMRHVSDIEDQKNYGI